MNINPRNFVIAILTISIISASFLLVQRFILPLAWAATVAVATFPIYAAWQKWWGKYNTLAALFFTLLIAIIIVIPVSWFFSLFFKETHAFIVYLIKINKFGEPVPDWLKKLPWMGQHLSHYWQQYLGKPDSINEILHRFHISLSPASQIIKQIGLSLADRAVILFFFILCLFFMYRDGNRLSQQINQIGHNYLGERWVTYAHKVPAAIRATVNGTIFVALGVGILMAISYSLAHIPAPVLLGFVTAILAMIPFGAPLVFVIVAIVLFAQGSILAGILLLIWGFLVMFVADHLIKPLLIGNATRLHFLVVLFGILGGVETLGLIGLFLGPILMVLFTTWWTESQKPLTL
ncbi:MAG: AI-2E family transporter [Coxiella sp. RIFCSPHIGHO2_12_FULL_44_14]|nr:MAG: AI-2E family transporter [Coxiella sp. RIFCSPHIGHO2_12_FULL_44_14]